MPSRQNDYVEIFQDADDMWRWRRKAANNEIISGSEESYVAQDWAEQMAHDLNPGVEIRVVKE